MIPQWILMVCAGIVVLITGFLTGRAYTLASSLGTSQKGIIVAKNYSADLFGSAFGAFLVPVFLFPVLGLGGIGVLLFVLNLGGVAWLWISRRNFVPL